MKDSSSSIRRSQRTALYYRALSALYQQLVQDQPSLAGLFINRVELSPDGSTCSVYFYCPEGEEAFREKLQTLKLFKPSIRKALATSLKQRMTPDITFKFDNRFEKHQQLEELLEQVSKESKPSND